MTGYMFRKEPQTTSVVESQLRGYSNASSEMSSYGRRTDSRTSLRHVGWYGTFRVHLRDLHANSRPSPGDLVEPKIRRLIIMFKDDCQRENSQNRIRGTVPLSKDLPPWGAHRVDGRHDEVVSPFPVWRWGLIYFRDGRHRLEAAQRTFPETEQWWGVDVWVEGMSSGLQSGGNCVSTRTWLG